MGGRVSENVWHWYPHGHAHHPPGPCEDRDTRVCTPCGGEEGTPDPEQLCPKTGSPVRSTSAADSQPARSRRGLSPGCAHPRPQSWSQYSVSPKPRHPGLPCSAFVSSCHDVVLLVQSLSRVRLFTTPRAAARQASLSFTNCRSLLKPMSIESVMPSNHLSSPFPPAFNLSQHQGLFQ